MGVETSVVYQNQAAVAHEYILQKFHNSHQNDKTLVAMTDNSFYCLPIDS